MSSSSSSRRIGSVINRQDHFTVSRARRQFLGLGLAALVAAGLRSEALASGVQVLHRTKPPLPALGPSFRVEIDYAGALAPGSIAIDAAGRTLTFVAGKGHAYRYRISVGREGFGWSGSAVVGAKKEWPEWRPPAEMRARSPDLPESVPPGPYNPLGARALYLFHNGTDTLYRIHGTNHPDGVGFDGTSGCFRMTNTDVMDLYERVRLGAAVRVA